MSTRISISKWIIQNIGIPIEGLRIIRIRDNGIGGDKPPQGGIVVAGFVEVEAGAAVQFLARVFVRDICSITAPTRITPRERHRRPRQDTASRWADGRRGGTAM